MYINDTTILINHAAKDPNSFSGRLLRTREQRELMEKAVVAGAVASVILGTIVALYTQVNGAVGAGAAIYALAGFRVLAGHFSRTNSEEEVALTGSTEQDTIQDASTESEDESNRQQTGFTYD